ncbi:hypothetical protein [Magnetococcus sp. PR-3]|uniref:hypothetical protein n=1 Tax=Magnetococcus sp. PR-3 TaxID=3120355 RepID=UPI002FCE044B
MHDEDGYLLDDDDDWGIELPMEEIAEAFGITELELEVALETGRAEVSQTPQQVIVNGELLDSFKIIISLDNVTVSVNLEP